MARVVAAPEAYQCPVRATVVRAADPSEPEQPEASPNWSARAEADLGWGRYCSEVETHTLSGDHGSILREPQVTVLADLLRGCLERAEADEPARPRELEIAEATHAV
jgi:thioesterase domain-containing protein